MIFHITLFMALACSEASQKATRYSLNQDEDAFTPITDEYLIENIGYDKFWQLTVSLDREDLDRLSYGMGASNIVSLVNAISDVNKLADLMSGVSRLLPEEMLELLEETDNAIGAENPPSDDTIGKMANLINKVDDMMYIQEIVHGVMDFGGQTGIQRLALTVALADETVDTMPVILNQVANTLEGRTKLLRIFNETVDLRKLTTVINLTTVLTNLTGSMNNLTNPETGLNGTTALITTLNNIGDPSKLAYLINKLDITGIISNDDDFESGTMTSLNWATSGNNTWKVTGSSVFDGSSALAAGESGLNDLQDGEVAALELLSNITADGTMSFAFRTSTGEGSDYLKFYVDDVLQNSWSGTNGWQEVNVAVTAGIHRFRWEYQKDASGSGGSDAVWIDKVVVPGHRGSPLFPYQKVAIMLNQLAITAESTIADTLNNLTATGIDCLANVVNRTVYPADYSTNEPRIVTIVNNLDAIENLTGTLNGLTLDASYQLAEIMDHTLDISKISGLVNGLTGIPGQKMYEIINRLNSTGTSAITRIIDGIPLPDLLEMINNVNQTMYMPDIFNNLDLSGTPVTIAGVDSSPTAAERMAQIINTVSGGVPPGDNLSIQNHLVRLINDISEGSGAEGAANVGKIVSGLDNEASPDGCTRMVTLMSNLATSDLANKYDDPLCSSGDCFSDHFGRLTTFMNDIFGGGAESTVRMINEIDSDKLSRLTDLIRDVKRVRYISDVINNMTNVSLMITLLNDPDLAISRMRRLCDTMGDHTYPGSTPPATRYTDPFSTDTVDALGRMTVLINEVVTPTGATNMTSVMCDTADFNTLTGMIGGINEDGSAKSGGVVQRIRYMSDLMNNVENIDLMINILNGFTSPATSPVDYAVLVKVINEIGGSTRKGDGAKSVGDVSILYGTINKLGWDYGAGAPRSNTEQAKLITLMNNVNKCGIDSAYDLNNPEGHLIAEPCSSGNKRVSDFMLGMNDAFPVSIIIGDVTDVWKTIRVMNGMRDIEGLIDFINYVPGEVTSTFLNTNDSSVIYTSTLFLMNRLDAKALACFIHYGTGIGDYSDRSGPVSYFTGVGPVRAARLMNAETGPRLLNLLNNFGWRTSIPSMTCGFGTPNAAEPQWLDNKNGGSNQALYRQESIAITNDPHRGNYTHYYKCREAECNAYYPDKAYGNICESKTDTMDHIIYYGGDVNWGFAGCFLSSDEYIPPGITSAWDLVNGDGFLAWMTSAIGVYIGYPPNPKWWANGNIDPEIHAPVQY